MLKISSGSLEKIPGSMAGNLSLPLSCTLQEAFCVGHFN